MIDNWFEGWLDIDVIDKKEQDNEVINSDDFPDACDTSDNSAVVL